MTDWTIDESLGVAMRETANALWIKGITHLGVERITEAFAAVESMYWVPGSPRARLGVPYAVYPQWRLAFARALSPLPVPELHVADPERTAFGCVSRGVKVTSLDCGRTVQK